MKKSLTLTLIFTCLLFAKPFAQWVAVQDSLALVDLYDSTAGATWNNNFNWKTTEPVASWSGVSVINNRVNSLTFRGNHMIGKIPASFKNLTGLTNLYLLDNGLKADLNEFLGSLTSLAFFHVGEYDFTAAIPASISNLVSLQEFTLYGSFLRLTQLPSSMKTLTNLTNMDVQDNALSGDISNAIPPNLTALNISMNRFTFDQIEDLAKRFANNPQMQFYYDNQAKVPIATADDKLWVSAGGTVANNTYKWYRTGAGLTDIIVGDSVYHPTAPGTYYAEVSNAIATGTILTSNETKTAGTIFTMCAGADSLFLNADITGSTYQWQVSTDSVNYTNLSNSATYGGVTTSRLNINNLPSSMYGTRYRCMVNGNTSTFFTIVFTNKWTGTTGNSWENAVNWGCGNLPDENTDVIIQTGALVINSNVTVKSIQLSAGASLTVNPGYTLTIKKK